MAAGNRTEGDGIGEGNRGGMEEEEAAPVEAVAVAEAEADAGETLTRTRTAAATGAGAAEVVVEGGIAAAVTRTTAGDDLRRSKRPPGRRSTGRNRCRGTSGLRSKF